MVVLIVNFDSSVYTMFELMHVVLSYHCEAVVDAKLRAEV